MKETNLHAYQLKLHQLYLKGLLLSMCMQRGATKGAVGGRHAGRQTIGKMGLLLGKHVDTPINCGGVRELIRPLLWIDVHVLGKQVGQLIIFFPVRLLIVRAGGETRYVEGGAGSSRVGDTHGGGANTASAEARKKGSAMTGWGGGGHG